LTRCDDVSPITHDGNHFVVFIRASC